MILPSYVALAVERLEAKGYEAWAVGGCVRDASLGLIPHDYDLCTNALPEQIKAVFADYQLVLAGEKHGTVTVLTQGGPLEITTFRLEGDYADSRRPGWVRFVQDIDLDLSRRDFTVNAMAFSPTRGLRDPFGGREDLKNKILRAVGDPMCRFSEDALRILRGLRFSARFELSPEKETMDAMVTLSPLLDKLARERVFEELNNFMCVAKLDDLLRFERILARAIPELEATLGFDQHSPYHIYNVYEHTAHVVAAVPATPELRWAALLHDIGKPGCFTLDENGRGHFLGHAKLSAEMADQILLKLRAPTQLRCRVTDLIARHMTPLEADPRLLRRRMGRWGVEETLDLLALQRADMGSKGTEEPDIFAPVEAMIRELLEEKPCFTVKDLEVNGKDLIALGYPAGPGLGRCMESLLEMVQQEQIPNIKEDLLRQARSML